LLGANVARRTTPAASARDKACASASGWGTDPSAHRKDAPSAAARVATSGSDASHVRATRNPQAAAATAHASAPWDGSTTPHNPASAAAAIAFDGQVPPSSMQAQLR
jgi:hypothetical protein